MTDARVTLKVNGVSYNGWTKVSVTRSIETIAGSFSLSVSERWPGQPVARAIHNRIAMPGRRKS